MSKVTQAEFARQMRVNRSTVNRWIKSGRIQADDHGLIDVGAAAEQRLASESPLPHHQARKATFEMARGADVAPDTQPQQSFDLGVASRNDGMEEGAGEPDATQGMVGVNDRYKAAMAREREAKAELAAMEVDRLAGALLDRAEVDFVFADVGQTIRSKLEALPDTLAEQLGPLQGDMAAIRSAIEEAMRDVLGDMAALMKRRMEGLGK